MNLQITVPYQTCPFKCPFCIANDPKVQSAFANLYNTNPENYYKTLLRTLRTQGIKTVVITGDTEPTLNMNWVKNTVEFIKATTPSVKIEIQTRNYNLITLLTLDYIGLDVIALSVYKTEQIELVRKIKFQNALKRLVVVLNKNFDQNLADYTGFDQVTIKQIQLGNNAEINKWINENKTDFVEENLLEYYPLISFMFDENCMDNANRYLIFREDGKVYADWASTSPM